MSIAPTSHHRRGFLVAFSLLLTSAAVAGIFTASVANASPDQDCWYAFKKGVNRPGDLCTESGSLQNDRDTTREKSALSARSSSSQN